MSTSIEFKGIPSGDYEGFCWDVDKETFIKIKGEKPNKYDRSYFNKGLYRIYPREFYNQNGICSTTIKVNY